MTPRAVPSASWRSAALWMLVPVTAVLAVAVGGVMAEEGTRRLTLVLALSASGALVSVAALLRRHVPPAFVSVELPVGLLLFSTLVLRTRSLDDISFDPLDPAAQVRVASLLLAGLLGAAAVLAPRRAADLGRLETGLRLYVAYVVIVVLGAFLSVNIVWTLFRAIELAAAILVVAGACRTVGSTAAAARLETFLFGWLVAMVGSVWMGVVLFPDEAIGRLLRQSSPIRFNVVGVHPTFSANAVGFLGVLLAVWAITRLTGGTGSRRRNAALAVIGVVTLLGAQYRTGYLAFTAALLVLLVVRRMYRTATVALLLGASIVVAVPSLVVSAEPYVLRGQTVAEAQELSSRVMWWKLGLEVWEKSPLLGRGLLTATRVEALGEAGYTNVSSIHSTWVEALVGTGVVGVAALAAFLLFLVSRALAHARPPTGDVLPLVLLTVICVRSVTGKTFEALALELLIMLWLSVRLARRPDAAPTSPPGWRTRQQGSPWPVAAARAR